MAEWVLDGHRFRTIKDLAAHVGLHPSTVGRRLRSGWSLEEAVGRKPPPKRRGHGIPVVWKGIEYPHLEALAAAIGVDGDTFRARLYRGYTIAQAVAGIEKPRRGGAAKPISYRGLEYPSRKALAAAYRTTGVLLQKRLKAGWTLAQALGDEPPPPRFRNFEGHARESKWKETRTTATGIEPVPDADGFKLYLIRNKENGKEYVGITVGSLEDRFKQHISAARRGRKAPLPNALRKHGEECFEIMLLRSDARSWEGLQDQEIKEIARRRTIQKGYNSAAGGSLGTAKPITVGGQPFPSRAQAAEHFGIDFFVFNMRLHRLGWTPEEAAGLVEREWQGKKKGVIVEGKEYRSIGAAARAYGKDPRQIYDRFGAKGWTIEQALGLDPPPHGGKYQGVALTVFGKTYPSIEKAAAALGIAKEPFRLRMLRGLSPDEAASRARKVVGRTKASGPKPSR